MWSIIVNMASFRYGIFVKLQHPTKKHSLWTFVDKVWLEDNMKILFHIHSFAHSLTHDQLVARSFVRLFIVLFIHSYIHLCRYKGSTRNRVGKRWIQIGGRLKQIDSGPFGIVWGINRHHNIYCRIGITWRNPKGRGWRHVGGKLKYASAGEFGIWGVNRYNNIYFRYGVTRRRPQGKENITMYCMIGLTKCWRLRSKVEVGWCNESIALSCLMWQFFSFSFFFKASGWILECQS